MPVPSAPICQKCGRQHRGYSNLDYLECHNCCKEVGSGKLNYPGGLCDECHKARRDAEDAKKKANARPGLVEVGRYAYMSNIKGLEVGDVVLLPVSWLDELKGQGPQEGTITCLYSDYDGPVKSIIRLVRKGNKNEPLA
jgi:hypothetical protein